MRKLARRISSVVCLSCLLLLSYAASVPADEEFGKPDATSKRVSKIVANLMQQHLSNRKLNNEISERALNMFLKNLDPMKMYFMKSDIDEFSTHSHMIDDLMKQGDYGVAFKIFNRFLKRIDERVELAAELIDSEFDYTKDESLITDRDLVDYAVDEGDARERWRKRIKFNLMVYANEENQTPSTSRDSAQDPGVVPTQDPKERLRKRYRSFANRMKQFDNEDVIEMYISAITTSFDPHTSYMSKTSYENFLINMRLELEGIGATLQSTDDGLTVIRRIVPGGAADKHGKLKVEDKIVAVGQESGEMVDIMDMKLDDVVGMIRGKAGTVVRLGVISPGTNDIKTLSITRERIELKDSEARGVVFESGKKPDGTPYRIGVIDLPSFYTDMESATLNIRDFKSSTRDVRRILNGFREDNVDGVVLDLRRNGGGSLREAIDLTGLFIDKGPVVQAKDLYGQLEIHNDEDLGMAWDGPLLVLTSKFSASASEILAGAVKDYKRGIVVGDQTTHGKGTVQTLLNLSRVLYGTRNPPPDLGALKITIQQFYRPNGDSTQKRGVLSDIVLPSISDKMDVGEADLEFPVEFDHISPARYDVMNLVTANMINQLRESSERRIDESEEFRKQIKKIEKYVEQKEQKSVSLNEQRFNERRKEMDADKEDEKTIEDQVNHTNEDIERDYYMDEVLHIMVDYIDSLHGGPLAKK